MTCLPPLRSDGSLVRDSTSMPGRYSRRASSDLMGASLRRGARSLAVSVFASPTAEDILDHRVFVAR
jgi:hypothetical protein